MHTLRGEESGPMAKSEEKKEIMFVVLGRLGDAAAATTTGKN